MLVLVLLILLYIHLLKADICNFFRGLNLPVLVVECAFVVVVSDSVVTDVGSSVVDSVVVTLVGSSDVESLSRIISVLLE